MMKDRNLAVRVPAVMFEQVQASAADFGSTASQVARLLLEAWLRAVRDNPNRIVWPPQFCVHSAVQPIDSVASLTYARAEHPPALVADRPGNLPAKPRG